MRLITVFSWFENFERSYDVSFFWGKFPSGEIKERRCTSDFSLWMTCGYAMYTRCFSMVAMLT